MSNSSTSSGSHNRIEDNAESKKSTPVLASIFNPPIRCQRGLVVIPWEFGFFKEVATHNENIIKIDELISAYENVMRMYGLDPIARYCIIDQLDQISTLDGSDLVVNNTIRYQAFTGVLNWFIKIRKHYAEDTNQLDSILLNSLYCNNIDWHKNGLTIATALIDIIIAGLIVGSHADLPVWLIFARIFAVIILTNVMYLLIPLVSASNLIPDRILANGFPAEHSNYYHKIFGMKVFVASAMHSLGHVLQIRHALKFCVNGCTRRSIHIIPYANHQTLISWGYFSKQYAYATGIILMILFAIMALSIVLNKKQIIRYSSNQHIHKYISLIGMIMIVAHGCSNLLGFNYSFVFTLPLLTAYLWHRRYEIKNNHVRINKWTITPLVTKLYLQDDQLLNDMLDTFENVTVYVNYPKVSKIEWHPFTLSRGYGTNDAILSMKRVGIWTNSISNILLNKPAGYDHLNIGHYTRSKFRFHRLYQMRYFFCAGIGITAFMAAMADMIRNSVKGQILTVLIWSVDSIDIINEFRNQIIDIQSKLQNIKVLIYYSNRSKRTRQTSQKMQMRFLFLQSLLYGHSQLDIVTGKRNLFCCSLQRVDFMKVLTRAVLDVHQTTNKISQVGVFICGSKSYVNNALMCVNTINRNKYSVRFRAWSECA